MVVMPSLISTSGELQNLLFLILPEMREDTTVLVNLMSAFHGDIIIMYTGRLP